MKVISLSLITEKITLSTAATISSGVAVIPVLKANVVDDVYSISVPGYAAEGKAPSSPGPNIDASLYGSSATTGSAFILTTETSLATGMVITAIYEGH